MEIGKFIQVPVFDKQKILFLSAILCLGKGI